MPRCKVPAPTPESNEADEMEHSQPESNEAEDNSNDVCETVSEPLFVWETF
jgi:hypothetical protein